MQQQRNILVGVVSLMLFCLLWTGAKSTLAQSNVNNQPAANAVYLPMIAGGTSEDNSTPTPTVTPTTTGNPTGTPTSTPTTQPVTLPVALVATAAFDLNSPEGMWFDFGADATYRYGERNHGQADDQGCINQWWIYQTGTINIVGGRITITPVSGMLHQQNSCPPFASTQEPWLDEGRDYTWFYRDRTTEIKLVLIPLARFVEFIFSRP